MGGTYAAVGALAAVHRARRTGHGEHVDFSLLEVMNLAGSNYMDTFFGLLGRPPVSGSAQTVETPEVPRGAPVRSGPPSTQDDQPRARFRYRPVWLFFAAANPAPTSS